MTIQNFIKKCNKKAYKSIRRIKSAHNMLVVEDAINQALLDTFGMYNIGMIKILMGQGQEYPSYGTDFDQLKATRTNNKDMFGKDVKQYLISFIPERMKVTAMYQKMIAA